MGGFSDLTERKTEGPVAGNLYLDPLRNTLLVFVSRKDGDYCFTYLLRPEHETRRKMWEISYLQQMSEMEALAWTAESR